MEASAFFEVRASDKLQVKINSRSKKGVYLVLKEILMLVSAMASLPD